MYAYSTAGRAGEAMVLLPRCHLTRSGCRVLGGHTASVVV